MSIPVGWRGARLRRVGAGALRAAALIGVGLLAATGRAHAHLDAPQATQSPSPTSPQQQRLVAASERLTAGDSAGAKAALDEAIALAHAAGDGPTEAAATRGLGLVFVNQKDYARARAAFEEALQLFRTLNDRRGAARTNQSLGLLSWTLALWADVRKFYAAAAEDFGALGDRVQQALALRDESFDPTLTASEETTLLSRALELLQPLGEPRGEGLVLHQWGDLFWRIGDYAGSLEKLESAATRLEAAGTPLERSLVATSLGRAYRYHGQAEIALLYYGKAMAIQEALGDRRAISQSLVAMALARADLDEFAEAAELATRSIAVARLAGPGIDIANLVAQLAFIQLRNGRYDTARALVEPTLAEPTLSTTVELSLRATLALTDLATGRPDDAAREIDRAVALGEGGDQPLALMRVLDIRAQVRERRGDIAGARVDCDRALALMEQLRAHAAPLDALKQEFTTTARGLFSLAIGLDVRAGDAASALIVAEQATARALQDLLEARSPTRDPSAKDTSRANAPMASASSAGAPTLENVRAVAARLKSPVLEYWVAPQETFAWVVNPAGGISVTRIVIDADRLSLLIRQATPRSGGISGAGDAAARRTLYDLLVAPLLSTLESASTAQVTIVPHGPLFHLSFAALQDARGRYLVERFEVHYAPAIGVLRFTESLVHRRTAASALLIADPDVPRFASGERLASLSGARQEVRDAAQVLGAGATVLVGAQATERAVRDLTAGRDVLHFATHAIVTDQDPLGSYLVLGATGSESAADGRLTAGEIYRLSLSADLVILSACRSAGGKLGGDGIAGLTRGFFSAGVPSVLATLWDVGDESTAYLMRRFYQHWRGTTTKAAALRLAQIDLLKALRAGSLRVKTPFGRTTLRESPFLWAGFILIGES